MISMLSKSGIYPVALSAVGTTTRTERSPASTAGNVHGTTPGTSYTAQPWELQTRRISRHVKHDSGVKQAPQNPGSGPHKTATNCLARTLFLRRKPLPFLLRAGSLPRFIIKLVFISF